MLGRESRRGLVTLTVGGSEEGEVHLSFKGGVLVGKRGNVIDCSHSPGYELIKVTNESSANVLPASKH